MDRGQTDRAHSQHERLKVGIQVSLKQWKRDYQRADRKTADDLPRTHLDDSTSVGSTNNAQSSSCHIQSYVPRLSVESTTHLVI